MFHEYEYFCLIGRKDSKDEGSLKDPTNCSGRRCHCDRHPPHSDVTVSGALRHKRLVIFDASVCILGEVGQ